MHDARDRNAGIWIQASDRLYVAAYSSVASLAVQVSGYFRRANGDVSEYAVTITPTSDRAVTARDVHFGEGFLLSCVASLVSGNASRGQCYVRAQVQRGTGTAAVKLHTVVAGYVTDEYSPSFPYGTQEGPLEGPGAIIVQTVADPAAGDPAQVDFPAGCRRRVLGITGFFLAAAGAGNRNLVINLFHPSGNGVYSAPSPTVVANGQLTFSAAAQAEHTLTIVDQRAVLAIPDIVLPALSGVLVLIDGVVAADQLSIIQVMCEEWLEA